jgi:hypothetical protein
MLDFESSTNHQREQYMARAKTLVENGLTNDPFCDIITIAKKLYEHEMRNKNED